MQCNSQPPLYTADNSCTYITIRCAKLRLPREHAFEEAKERTFQSREKAANGPVPVEVNKSEEDEHGNSDIQRAYTDSRSGWAFLIQFTSQQDLPAQAECSSTSAARSVSCNCTTGTAPAIRGSAVKSHTGRVVYEVVTCEKNEKQQWQADMALFLKNFAVRAQ
eukprot:jgi/Ulvmu1/5143/UM021_0160.1